MHETRAKKMVVAALGAVIVYVLLLINHPLPGMTNTVISLIIFVMAAAAMWRHGLPARLPALGFTLFSCSLLALLWLKSTGQHDVLSIDDPPRLLGIALLGYFCLRLPGDEPGFLWLLSVVYIACAVTQVLLCARAASIPWDNGAHALLEAMVIMASLPAVAAVMAGRAPSGRLLWFLGWQLRWLGHMAATTMESGVLADNITSLANLFILSTAFLSIGIVAEIRRWDMGLWPFVLGVGALLTGWLGGLIQLASAPDFIFLNLLVGGGVMIFANALILLASYLSTIRKTQAELTEQEGTLRQATSAKGEFLSSMSHELRTPLNAIIGFAEAMADGAMGTLDELQQELVFEIRRGGERLLHLINRVLDYSRLEAGRMPIVRQDIELASWLGKLLAPHLEHAQQKGIALHLDIKPDIKGWHLDPTLTQLAIDELLDNAMRFTDTGTITLQAELDEHHQLRITLTDTGPGIDESHRPRLYKPLEQFGRDRERGLQKAGLGLALAREAIMSQGGTLELMPSVQGACFAITLPTEPASRPEVMVRAPVSSLGQAETAIPPPRVFVLMVGVLLGVLVPVIVICSRGGDMLQRLYAPGMYFSTALCAVAVLLAWQAAPRMPFRLAACGAFLAGLVDFLAPWALQERLIVPYAQYVWFWLIADGLFFLAFAFLKPRRRLRLVVPGYALLALSTMQVTMLLVARQDYHLIDSVYIMLSLLGMGLTLPAVEHGLRGFAAPGRLVWTGGLVLFWLGVYGDSLAFALSGGSNYISHFYPLYTYSILMSAAGLFIESRRWDIGPWALILVVGSALLAWSMGTIVLRPFPEVLSYWVITGGCTIYLLALAILVAHHNRARHMTQALQQAHEEARRASADKTRFLTTMSHELRTPLNAVLGFADVLKSGDTGALEPEATEAIMEIETAGEHLLSLVEDIMDLNQIEEGVVTLDLVPVDLPTLLKNSLAIVKERAHRKGIHLELDLDPRIGSCLLDARKVKQLVFNLLSNAVKFTPDRGTVTLAAHLVSRTEVLAHQGKPGFNAQTLNDTQTFLALTVSDSGIGIAPEDLPKLFQKYSQLDAGRQQQGTGLGLSLVKGFAELHGGTVMVESEVGKGSSFVVWLPMQ